jgi:hypothetical protein
MARGHGGASPSNSGLKKGPIRQFLETRTRRKDSVMTDARVRPFRRRTEDRPRPRSCRILPLRRRNDQVSGMTRERGDTRRTADAAS